jgi:DNA polymerase I
MNLQNLPRATPFVPSACNACNLVFKDDNGIHEDTFTVDTTKSRYVCTRCGQVNKTFTYDLRRMFIPREGMKFVAADYRNMELYLAATVSGCQSLYDVFLKKEKDGKDPNGDMHVVTASSILGITPDAWLVLKESKKEADRKQAKEARTTAKTVNFLTLYGGSAQGLKDTFQSMGVDRTIEECLEYIEAFFRAFPEVKEWFDKQKYTIQADGRVVNAYGRIRHVLKEGSETLSAINMLIQGLGAQIIKESLVEMDTLWEGKDWYPLLIIHDENIIEVPEGEIDLAEKGIIDIMEISVKDKLKVNLKVDCSAGVSSLSKTEMI